VLRRSAGRADAMTAAPDIIETEVRELVRRRGLDPAHDPGGVRSIIDEVIAEYDERALSSSLPPVGDEQQVARSVLDAVAGFGPLQRWLDDAEVEEISIDQPGKVFVARRGRSELTTTTLTAGEIRDLVERMLRTSGRRVDLAAPFVDAVLPDGSRLHVVIPPVTRRHVAVNIRKFVVAARSLDDLVSLGTLTLPAARFLEAAVAAGLNIIVAGGTQAGKTTFLNALCAAVPARERVITCEEVFELQPLLPDVVSMQTRQANLEGAGEITLRRLVKEALRMRPSRIVVGEVRQEECLDLLIALNSGIPGMCSIHANSAREALVKLCTLPLLAGENVTHAFVVPTVAASVDVVVHLTTDHSGRRQVREIVAVPGRVEGLVVETEDLYATRDDRLARADGYPPHPERFARLGIDLAELLAGTLATAHGGEPDRWRPSSPGGG
jgi:pilus assembly protein CpaF